MSFSHDVAGGNGNLNVTAVKSPNFVHGVSGWSINKDGSAEFQDVVLPEGSGGAVVTFAATAPSSPHVGDLWYNTSDGLEANQWNGTAWVPYKIGSGGINGSDIIANIIDGATITGNTINGATFNGTNWVENSYGSFLYSGTPAAGNLIASIAPVAGNDAAWTSGAGNNYQEGVTSYSTGIYVSLDGGQLNFSNGAYISESTNYINFGGKPLNIMVPINSVLDAVQPGTTATAEGWHTLTLANSWTGTLQYKLKPDNTVMLRSQGTLTVGTRTTGTTIGTLPTGYRPTYQADMPISVTANTSGAASVNSPFFTIATTGVITVANISTQVATNVAVLGSFPLD